MADITVKRGDTRPLLVRNLKQTIDGTETAINLATASSVKVIIKPQAGGSALGGTASITSASTGEVTYTLQVADTTTAGTYNVEYEIAWNDGGYETVPNDSYVTLLVVADLGGTA